MRRTMTTALAVVALAAGLAAQHGKAESTSLTGTWNMGLQGGHVIPVALVLKQDGEALTGVVSQEPTVDPGRFRGPDDAYPGHWTSAGAPRPCEEPEGGVLNREVATLIESALADLPERQRLVVQMRDIQGMSSAEACAALAVSEPNQRVLLHRGRSALRAALEGYHAG